MIGRLILLGLPLGIGVALKLKRKKKAVESMDVSFAGLRRGKVDVMTASFSADLALEFFNPTGEPLAVDAIAGQIWLAGKSAGQVMYTEKDVIDGLSRTTLEIPIRIKLGAVVPNLVQNVLSFLNSPESVDLGIMAFKGYYIQGRHEIPFEISTRLKL